MPPRQPTQRVAVVGGGVIGLTSALLLSDKYNVSIVAEKIGASTDSLKATAIWHVYLVPETEEILYWAQRSLEKLFHLTLEEPEAGVELVRGVELFRKGKARVPAWSHIPRFFKMLTDEEIGFYNNFDSVGLSKSEIALLKDNPVVWGYHIEVPAAHMLRYLSWLEGCVRRAGASFKKKRVTVFDEIASEYDVIVNCTGFSARELVKDDAFIPYKGQYFVLNGNSCSPKTYVGDDDHPSGMAYMIPRSGEVLVGGCADEGVEDLEFSLDWATTIRRAGLFVPWLRTRSLKDQSRSPVVGIRPCRTGGVRLEIDSTSASIPIIHNYGHGGSGFSLSWGCAEKVKALIASM